MTSWDRNVEAAFRFAYHGEYRAAIGDPHYQAEAPIPSRPCRCDQPGLVIEDGEPKCWRCGRAVESEPTQNAHEGVGPLHGSVRAAG